MSLRPRKFSSDDPPFSRAPGPVAFTLIELLVVIAILGLLAVIGLPALKGIGKSNAITAATRQLLDDVALARQRAIADRTTIYLVFVPPVNQAALSPFGQLDADQLIQGQYVSYALFSFRSVGDQPGRPRERYRSTWKTLPERTLIAPWKFINRTVSVTITNPPSTFIVEPLRNYRQFPYPTNGIQAVRLSLPYIAFDFQGRLVRYNNNTGAEELVQRDEFLPLSVGSILHDRNAAGQLLSVAAQPQEIPAGNATNAPNLIHIDALTGRARVEREQL